MKGPYRIIECTSLGDYIIQLIDQPTGAHRKYPASTLAPLLAHLFPCMPVDSTDFWFLNAIDGPVHHPLKVVCALSTTMTSGLTDTHWPNPMQPDHTWSHTHHLQQVQPNPSNPQPLYCRLFLPAPPSFFVSFRAAGTLRPQWSLVQVDLPCTKRDPYYSNASYRTTGLYFVHFFRQHPNNKSQEQSTRPMVAPMAPLLDCQWHNQIQ